MSKEGTGPNDKSVRVQKVEKELREIISQTLPECIYLEDNVLLTVVRVQAASDLRTAKVFISVFPDEAAPDVMHELEEVRVDIQSQVSKKIRMKYLPKLTWMLDKTLDQMVKMHETIKESKKND